MPRGGGPRDVPAWSCSRGTASGRQIRKPHRLWAFVCASTKRNVRARGARRRSSGADRGAVLASSALGTAGPNQRAHLVAFAEAAGRRFEGMGLQLCSLQAGDEAQKGQTCHQKSHGERPLGPDICWQARAAALDRASFPRQPWRPSAAPSSELRGLQPGLAAGLWRPLALVSGAAPVQWSAVGRLEP